MTTGPADPAPQPPPPAEALLARARLGDAVAWETLTERTTGFLWGVARALEVDQARAAHAVEAAWLRLLDQPEVGASPGSVDAWLAAATRWECLRMLQSDRRGATPAVPGPAAEPARWWEAETDPEARVLQCLRLVGPRCEALLRVLAADPTPSYAAVAAALNLPVGSVGPSRMRCLRRLRELLAERGFAPA